MGVKDAFAIARRLGDLLLYFCGTCAACNSCARAISFLSLPSIEASPMCSSCNTPSASIVNVCGIALTANTFAIGRSESAVAVLRPAHFVLADELFPRWFVRVQAYAQSQLSWICACLNWKNGAAGVYVENCSSDLRGFVA